MNYFVSVNQCAYHYWQMELLIESFKKNRIEKDLAICYNSDKRYRYDQIINLKNHKKIFAFEDFGKKKGFSGLNELYQIYFVVEKKLIDAPVVIMKSHVVLQNPIDEIKKIKQERVFLYAQDPFFTFDFAEENCNGFWEKMKNTKEYYQEKWINLGNVFVINAFHPAILWKIILIAEEIMLGQIIKNKEIWKETIRLSWIIAMIDYQKDIQILNVDNLCSIMNDGKKTMFIDYEHGVPPHFNKSMFSYPSPEHFSFGDPIKIISECMNTPNAHYMAILAKSILDQRGKIK